MSNKILVTGCNGFLASYLIPELAKIQGLQVHGTDIHKQGISGLKKYYSGNLCDKNFVASFDSDYNTCIHLASVVSAESKELIKTMAVEAGKNLIHHFKQSEKETHFIFSSSLSVYEALLPQQQTENNPVSDYATSKIEAEKVFINSGLKYSILRFSAIYDAFSKAAFVQKLLYLWIDAACRGEDLVIFGKGLNLKNYLFVSDAVNAIIRVFLEKCSGIFTVFNPEFFTLEQLANKIIQLCESKSKIIKNEEIKNEKGIFDFPELFTDQINLCTDYVSLEDGLKQIINEKRK